MDCLATSRVRKKDRGWILLSLLGFLAVVTVVMQQVLKIAEEATHQVKMMSIMANAEQIVWETLPRVTSSHLPQVPCAVGSCSVMQVINQFQSGQILAREGSQAVKGISLSENAVLLTVYREGILEQIWLGIRQENSVLSFSWHRLT